MQIAVSVEMRRHAFQSKGQFVNVTQSATGMELAVLIGHTSRTAQVSKINPFEKRFSLVYLADTEQCVTGKVRLIGGAPNTSSGLLEVCADGHWGRVCDYRQKWADSNNAAVVCHQLNYPTTSKDYSRIFEHSPCL